MSNELYMTYAPFDPCDCIVRLIVDDIPSILGTVRDVKYDMNQDGRWDARVELLLLGGTDESGPRRVKHGKSIDLSILNQNEFGRAVELKFINVQDFKLHGHINAGQDGWMVEVLTFNTFSVDHWVEHPFGKAIYGLQQEIEDPMLSEKEALNPVDQFYHTGEWKS